MHRPYPLTPPATASDPSPPQSPDWQAELAAAERDVGRLCRGLGLAASVAAEAEAAAEAFPLLVPRPYLRRIRPGDSRDPLLLQVLPRAEELADAPGFSKDPLREAEAVAAAGVLSKYEGRSLIVATPGCSVYCRFCFRRHRPCQNSPADGVDWPAALAWLARADSVREVVLSGGDPLILPDNELAALASKLSQIPHIRRLRIHTRLPVMIPQRVNEALLGWMGDCRLRPKVVVHINHPDEIDDAVAAALRRLITAGTAVLSQGVLLRGINDDVQTLARLYETLADLGVMPYYLHQLDRVQGAAHYEVAETVGVDLIARLRARLPGYAVPRYVREVPGRPGKVILA